MSDPQALQAAYRASLRAIEDIAAGAPAVEIPAEIYRQENTYSEHYSQKDRMRYEPGYARWMSLIRREHNNGGGRKPVIKPCDTCGSLITRTEAKYPCPHTYIDNQGRKQYARKARPQPQWSPIGTCKTLYPVWVRAFGADAEPCIALRIGTTWRKAVVPCDTRWPKIAEPVFPAEWRPIRDWRATMERLYRDGSRRALGER